MDNFVYNKSLRIYISDRSTLFDYSDGCETYLTKVFQNIEHIDPYPIDLQEYIKDWPTKYHLSYMRTNLLEAIKELFDRDWNVLEVGAGTGALTPWLCDTFKHVDCIEGSIDRAKAIGLRTKSRDNVRIFAGDIMNIDFSGHYDLVTLIGVLEYAPFYKPDKDPIFACKDLLIRLEQFVKEDGLLVIAIENKLGAKYFSGCHEDHNGELFSGIMDYPTKSTLTFSRNELEDILRQVGFTNITFYHVFPDYKIPTTIIKENSDIYEQDISGFIRGLFEDHSGNREYFFHDTLFVSTLVKAHLLHHFSNSFLVICSKNENVDLETSWMIKKFWNQEGTKPIFHHTISLEKHGSAYSIRRTPFRGGSFSLNEDRIKFNISYDKVFIPGKPLSIEAYKCAMNENYMDRLAILMQEILDTLLMEFSIGNKDEMGFQLVRGEAIDYCFWNLVRKEDSGLKFVDDKWSFNSSITEDFIIFRNLFYLFRDVYPFIEENDPEEFVIPIMKKLFSTFSSRRYDENLFKEAEFQSETQIKPVKVADMRANASARKHAIMSSAKYKSHMRTKEKQMEAILARRAWKIIDKYFKIKNRIIKLTRERGIFV
ncbi:MAG: class I SAM-dependent methyltransferase [Bacteroidetes bacterium]|nr:class I SAM-dependent methyltransferase [Prolixibacteraceae bacterium]MBP8975373.1 class I SAM-dependent methyltransferase [Bacteroidota bacterium]